MDQPVIIGIVMLGSFGLAGLLFGSIWRQPPFKVTGLVCTLAFIVAFIGVWLVLFQIQHLESYLVLRGWTSVPGVITDSRVVGERAYRPEIVYEYRVGSVLYRDSTSLDPPGFGGRNAKHDAAEGVASEYPIGKAVVIHYNPENPADSRLKITPPWSVYGQTGLGGFLFGAGMFLVALFFRARRNRTSV